MKHVKISVLTTPKTTNVEKLFCFYLFFLLNYEILCRQSHAINAMQTNAINFNEISYI